MTRGTNILWPLDSTRYPSASFSVQPDTAVVTVSARLIFRRAFKKLADAKRWAMPDLTMEEAVQRQAAGMMNYE